MKLQHLVIAVIIVGMVTTGIITFITDLGDNYGQTADFTGLEQTREAMADQMNQSEELQDMLDTELKEGDSFILVPYRLIKAGWTAIKSLIITPLNTLRIMINELGAFGSNTLGIPVWVQASLIAILTVTLITILVYAFFKWRFED